MCAGRVIRRDSFVCVHTARHRLFLLSRSGVCVCVCVDGYVSRRVKSGGTVGKVVKRCGKERKKDRHKKMTSYIFLFFSVKREKQNKFFLLQQKKREPFL